MTVAEMLDRISSAELSDWIEFYTREADDEKRAIEQSRKEARRGR